LNQQLDAVTRRPELLGLAFEHFEDADRSGKETSKRPGYLGLMERVRTAPAAQVGAVAFYDADRLHRNDLEFFRFMAEMTERRILVFDGNGLISNVDRLSWKIKAIVAQEEREKVARARPRQSPLPAAKRQVAGHDPAGLLPRRRSNR